eukprot:m.278051 g.278051  ORF g.278051 m.278051 type:complete len:61 (+) comp16153_c0_seq10:114-296(+)
MTSSTIHPINQSPRRQLSTDRFRFVDGLTFNLFKNLVGLEIVHVAALQEPQDEQPHLEWQ